MLSINDNKKFTKRKLSTNKKLIHKTEILNSFGSKKLWFQLPDHVNHLTEHVHHFLGGDLLCDGGYLLGDGGDLLGAGGDLL